MSQHCLRLLTHTGADARFGHIWGFVKIYGQRRGCCDGMEAFYGAG